MDSSVSNDALRPPVSVEPDESAPSLTVSLACATVDLLARAGIECGTVSGAGTGTCQLEAASGVYNELQGRGTVFDGRRGLLRHSPDAANASRRARAARRWASPAASAIPRKPKNPWIMPGNGACTHGVPAAARRSA